MANSKFRCPGCKEYHPSTEKVRLGVKDFHSLECGLKWSAAEGKKKAEKARVYRLKERRKETRAAKERLKTRSDYKREAQTAFNAYIRERDAGLPCVSCDKPDDGTHQRHASHYRSRGACPELAFEPLNVHASCAQCNGIKSGNIVEYRLRLISRIGREGVDWLEGPHKPEKYTIEDLQDMKAYYRRITRELKRAATEPAKPEQKTEPTHVHSSN